VSQSAQPESAPIHMPQFRLLSELQIELLVQATLECLNRTGVDVLNAQARELLALAGASVQGLRVRIPPSLIRDAIAAAPRSFSLWGRDPRIHLRIEAAEGQAHFGAGPTCPYFVEPETGERRRSQRGDPGLTARVCDALEHIDYVMGLALPDDVPPNLAPAYEFAAMVANTGKPIVAWAFSLDNVADIYRIAVAAAGREDAFRERPFVAFLATCQAPLMHTEAELANVFWMADRGLPIVYMGGGTAGVTAPIGGAGTLIINLGAILSGLAIIQLYKRGTPTCIGSVPTALDPASGRMPYGAPEMSLFSAAMSEITRQLGLPYMGTAGASEAKTLDAQAGIECAFQVIFSQLSGSTLPHDVGMLDSANIGSLEMLVMADEIIGMTRRITRGIEIGDLAATLDLIDRVGPGGEFISCKETARGVRREVYMTRLMDRQPWDQWQAAGSAGMSERARARVQQILAEHEPLPLPEGAAGQIDQVLREAEARLAQTPPLSSAP